MRTLRWILIGSIVAGLLGGMGFFAFLQLTEESLEPPVAAAPVSVTSPAPVAARKPTAEPLPEELGVAPPQEVDAGHLTQLNREGIEALEAGDLERAVELFETCAEQEPGERVFAHNLSQALLRLALRDRSQHPPCLECVELLERAVGLAPDREDMRQLLERWRLEDEAQKDFWRDSSLHFDLSYDGSRTELLWGSSELLDELERGYMDLGELFASRPVEEGRPRIQVVLYRRESFAGLTGLGDWAGGAFDGVVRVPVEDLGSEKASVKRVLRHELVHVFVREVGGSAVPGWLNEGLAQLYEGDAARTVAGARARLAGVELFPLERLEDNLASWSDVDEIAAAYAQSLTLCDHLREQYGERLLFRMVVGCGEGTAPSETFRRGTGVDLGWVLGELAGQL